MSDHPTAAQFYAAADMRSRHKEAFRKEWDERTKAIAGTIPSRGDLISIAVTAYGVAHDAAADKESMYASEWLQAQPAFVLAARAAKFMPSTIEIMAEKALRETELQADIAQASKLFDRAKYKWKAMGRQKYIGEYVADICGRRFDRRLALYLEYVSGVARCCGNYISGHTVRAALEGPETLARMQSLTIELQQLISATDWLWGGKQEIMERHLARISHHLDEMNSAPISRRRDASLPARLMASELIQLHHSILWRPCNRAVFQLMGLPFIEGQMEMRTIERLAKAERQRHKAEREKYQARLTRSKTKQDTTATS